MDVVLDSSNPADKAAIDALIPDTVTDDRGVPCDVYEDPANSNKRYYSKDNGHTYFDDVSNPEGSILDRNDPNYAALTAGFVELNQKVSIGFTWHRYHYNGPDGFFPLYTADGGQTYIRDLDHPENVAYDRADPSQQSSFDYITPVCKTAGGPITYYDVYYDPDDRNNKRYYKRINDPSSPFYSSITARPEDALDPSDSRDKAVLDRILRLPYYRNFRDVKEYPEYYYVYKDQRNDNVYYSADGGTTFLKGTINPYEANNKLDPNSYSDNRIIENLVPVTVTVTRTEYVRQVVPGAARAPGAAISTQQLAQEALVAIDRAVVSKDKIRAHLGAMQNRLENTVANLSIQAENVQAAEARISDTDTATEMANFVRSQILSQSAVAMLGQANSFPHMLMTLIG